ncbi:MAG: ATP-binding protein [Anaerolineae bacterium]|jgi:signal transduction histidine kinase|nr:ATP-binding protein [Anaerolineae bacterium]
MDFLEILIRPPGDLIYFLLTIAISLASLFMLFGVRRHRDQTLIYYGVALSGVVLCWAMLLGGAVISLLFNISADSILPPLERAVQVLTLILLIWVFLSADHQRWGQLPNLILSLMIMLTLVGYLWTATQWSQMVSFTNFNASPLHRIWTIVPLVLCIFAMAVTVFGFRSIVDAPLKLVFFLIIAIGCGLSVWQIPPGHYAGAIRLAFVTGIGITIALVYRAITLRLETRNHLASLPVLTTPSPIPLGELSVSNTAMPIERESAKLLRALGLILENSTPESVPLQIVNTSLELLRAEVGALLRLQDVNYADITAVYDRSMQRNITGISLNLENQPTLINVLQRRAQRPLFPDRNPNELSDIYARLNIQQIGPVYFQPLIHDQQIIAVLLVALPYTKRELYSEETELLKGIAVIAAGVLALSYRAHESMLLAEERAIQAMIQGVSPMHIPDQQVIAARQELQASLQLAREQINDLSKQVMTLQVELDKERTRITSALGFSDEDLSISQRITAINSEQENLRSERDQLARRLQEAETTLSGLTAQDDNRVVKDMIAVLQRERDERIRERDRLQAELDNLRRNQGLTVPESLDEMLERMTHEKAELQRERDEVSVRLNEIQGQMRQLGIEGGAAGLAYLIGQLYEHRTQLRDKNDVLQRERDRLLAENQTLRQFQDSDKMIKALQEQIKHLAADREAALTQRDQLRAQNQDLAEKIDSVKEHRARLLAQSLGYEQELQEAHDEQKTLRAEIQRLADQVSTLNHQLNKLYAEQRVKTPSSGVEDPKVINALQTMVADLSEQRNSLERELNLMRASLAEVKNRAEAAEIRADRHLITSEGYTTQNSDVVISLVQELRTPMTSIIGYVDLLLAESAGILGEMQRRFLERVSANVSRLGLMLEDLIRLTALDTGNFVLAPTPLDLIALIEDAITNAAVQFREKGLTVTIELEENLPLLNADHDAMREIIGQLLTNAYLVSPPDTDIYIKAMQREVRLLDAQGQPSTKRCLYVSVEDRGGGIEPEDEARVFARKYKAENPLIKGLGDTGVGLAIAKSLVEAHDGVMWLETKLNLGSNFIFVIPIESV